MPTANIIGGGPAGLMAAEVLARAGWQVQVFEHMPSVGRKLLLAGRSGLNLTNAEGLDRLLARYGDAQVIADAVRAFPPAALREWADDLGTATFVGSSGRVFPVAMRATPLLRAWLERLQGLGVQMHVRTRWTGWGAGPTELRMLGPGGDREHVVAADAVVFALGGASWPRVGSDGGWVAAFRDAGVDVRELRPANCGVHVAWSARFAAEHAGDAVKNVALSFDGISVRGDVTVTRLGLESGPVYTLAAAVRDAIERSGDCTLSVDLHPDVSEHALCARLEQGRPKDSLTTTLRRSAGLSPAAGALLREATGNDVPRGAATLARLIKDLPLTVHAVAPLARAISTAGGIALTDIDPRMMLRRLPGVFVAGEMLDWEAPTGGYLLQASFATGVAASRGVLGWAQER